MGHTCAKIVFIIFALDACATRRSISEEDSDSFFCSGAKKVSLLSAEWWYVSESWYLIRQSVPIILGADQTGQVEKEWDLGICGVWWQEQIEPRI